MEDIIATEKQTFDDISSHILDPEKQRSLLQQDEEEDFLDEASVNPNGNDCPQALKLVATVLLFEITAFLRETYQTLPKTSKLSTKEKTAPWEKVYRYLLVVVLIVIKNFQTIILGRQTVDGRWH